MLPCQAGGDHASVSGGMVLPRNRRESLLRTVDGLPEALTQDTSLPATEPLLHKINTESRSG